MEAQPTRHFFFWMFAFASMSTQLARAEEPNLDYVAEHLFEVTMDNRLAALPLWNVAERSASAWRFAAQLAYSGVESEHITISSVLAAGAIERNLNDRWSVRGIAFFDSARFDGGGGRYRLSPTYLQPLPSFLPAMAEFSPMSGTFAQRGGAIVLHRHRDHGWLDGSVWTIGIAWIEQDLNSHRMDYQVLDGPAVGLRGEVDYSTVYSFMTPFVGMQWRLQRVRWAFAPHWRYLLPLPRRGFVGSLRGPGFSLSGDSGSAGNGKYVSDQQLAVGMSVLHRPSGVSLDVGLGIAQYFLEPLNRGGPKLDGGRHGGVLSRMRLCSPID